jgi:6-pyruvoyltetrahydropterin/6-carboxytetrahydropterin synthase
MSTISVRTHFAAGHRILNLTGAGAKCRNIHGHTFHVKWTYQQNAGDMALEFGAMKESLRAMIVEHFDHAFILDRADEFKTFLRASQLKYYLLDGPPTTEAIVAEIAVRSQRIFRAAALLSVELGEGPDNAATWENPSYIRRTIPGTTELDPRTWEPVKT